MGTMTIAEEVGKRLTMDEALGKVLEVRSNHNEQLQILVGRVEQAAVRIDGKFEPMIGPDAPPEEVPSYLPERVVTFGTVDNPELLRRLSCAVERLEEGLGEPCEIQTGLD